MSCGELGKGAKTEHTPEPWALFKDDPRAIVTKEQPMLSLLSVDDDGMAIMFEKSDARRIVACVNACAGIPTDDLEHGDIAKALKIFALDSATFRRQRDISQAARHFAGSATNCWRRFVVHTSSFFTAISSSLACLMKTVIRCTEQGKPFLTPWKSRNCYLNRLTA